MADAEETPAQRQARIRRQKREAKISGAASERLDKITRLSGRTPESLRNDSPVATPPRSSTPSQVSSPSPGSDYAAGPTPEQQKAQEEYLRALLRQPEPQEGQNQPQQAEDPMLKMLQSMMGAMDGTSDPNAAGGAGFPGGLPGFSPDDISKATGLPSFLTNMVMGGQKAPPSQAEVQATRLWKILHVIFALVAGLYLVFTITRATATFGESPPRPATFQNPFVVFLTGELLVQGTRVATSGYSGKSGLGLWIQILREFVGDGAIAIFMLGIASWWKGST
ncbi:hypothetical protein LTR10_018774 [Elasticomyces elasticus]|uniref:GET complex, subunit GET2 n=1 Tax=Exophiala sideris TaxID=1016849 RepID=A0ABR0J8K1_9EURO|nr:hypothetical protein LTR10_018774 [Elasticomyces elasticus]KAK5029900.1 hypothetical protein LTS07_005624 [Exophiala sideris]KAK5031660.1 hypothetical protein LTR13_007650 [Exophiala sideris]KAK5058338.1 hypothetical protein LTR69_006743 [Exophiala sideris]KAK5180267.1 hypothetical protein LTR44_007393 [Eurotiomycetes sp. CCFEE 6388]